MDNIDDKRFWNNKISEEGRFPNLVHYYKTTGKRATAALTIMAALMSITSGLCHILPGLPVIEKDNYKKEVQGVEEEYSDSGPNDPDDFDFLEKHPVPKTE